MVDEKSVLYQITEKVGKSLTYVEAYTLLSSLGPIVPNGCTAGADGGRSYFTTTIGRVVLVTEYGDPDLNDLVLAIDFLPPAG